MWFRNLLIYRLTQDIPLGAEALEAALAAKPARPGASQWDSAVRLGEVYSAHLDDKKVDLKMTVRSEWERMLASLYFGNAVLLVDCEPDDFSYGFDD